MKKIITSLSIVAVLFSFSASAKEVVNPKDELTDKEYYSLRICDVNKKESEINVKDCRDAYSLRAIQDADRQDLEENSDQYIFDKSKR